MKPLKSGQTDGHALLLDPENATNAEGHLACDIILRALDDLFNPSAETFKDQVCVPDPYRGYYGCEGRYTEGCYTKRNMDFTPAFHACQLKRTKLQEEVLSFFADDWFEELVAIIDPRLDAETLRATVYRLLSAAQASE